jgi:hypothetical protein
MKFRTAIAYGGGLIGLYLLVAYAGGTAQVESAGGSGAVSLVQALQGR